MSLTSIIRKEMSVEEMTELAGPARCAGASGPEELVYAVLLTLAQRGEASALPVAALKRIDTSPVACRELQRVESCREVLEPNAVWSDIRHALEQLPPAALLHILDEEMSLGQMKRLADEERCKGATKKQQIVYAVLLALTMRELGTKELPPNAQRRLDAAPVCADWLEGLSSSCLRAGLAEGCATWRDFMRSLADRGRPAPATPASSAADSDADARRERSRASPVIEGVRSLFGRADKLDAASSPGALSGRQAEAAPVFDVTATPLWLPVVYLCKFANNKLLLLSFLSFLVYMI